MKKYIKIIALVAIVVLGCIIIKEVYTNRKKLEVSITGVNCDGNTPKVYLLLMNGTGMEAQQDIKIQLKNKQTKEKLNVIYSMDEVLPSGRMRLDTASLELDHSFNCDDYEVTAKPGKKINNFK
ncbi:hypothetical protein LJB95_00230 [Paludibacteraceae bacterium OttesenSCG-928-F17]|nr:hypothetical protein [Paludibacteraceae bacterium OttesenSCG-928-F17]